MNSRRLHWTKVTALILPFCLGVTALNLYGEPLRHEFRSLRLGGSQRHLELSHFLILYPSDVDEPRWAIDLLEKSTPALQEMINLQTLPSDRVISIHLTTTLREFPVGPLSSHPDPLRNDLYWYPPRLEMGLLLHDDPQSNRRRLLHGLTHALLSIEATSAGLSPWLDEGLAGLAESFAMEGPARPDLRMTTRVRDAMLGASFIPLVELLATRPERRTGEELELFRDESRLLVEFLLHLSPSRFHELLTSELETGPTSLLKLFGPPNRLEEKWRKYIRDLCDPATPPGTGD